MMRNPTEIHWETLAKKDRWAEADALEEKQNKLSKIFPCSLATCKEYHGNYDPECGHRGYCSSECMEFWADAAYKKAKDFLGGVKLSGGKIDLQEQDADWWATSVPGLKAISEEEIKALLTAEMIERSNHTEAEYKKIAAEVDQDGLQQVKLISSQAVDGSPCETNDVMNPKQPNIRKDSPEVDMYTYARKNARKLVELAVSVVKAVEGPNSPLLKDIAWNLKLPTSFYRKSKQMKEWDADASMICDVLRASAAFSNPAKLKKAVEYLKKQEKEGVENRIIIKTIENYFKDPCGGYMDMCLQIEFTGLNTGAGFVCELQLQLPEMYEFKKATGHKTYEWTRRFDSWLGGGNSGAVSIIYPEEALAGTALAATDENVHVGTTVRLVKDRAAFEAAFQTTSYRWDDAMESICDTTQTVVEKNESGIFGLTECTPNSGYPVWYFPFSVVESVVEGDQGKKALSAKEEQQQQ
jgi:hypothetical protein